MQEPNRTLLRNIAFLNGMITIIFFKWGRDLTRVKNGKFLFEKHDHKAYYNPRSIRAIK